MVAELVEQLEAARPARRGRPPKSTEAPPAPGSPWLPEGQLLANEGDVIRALQISESKLDDLVAARVLEPVRIDTVRRFHPRDVEALAERLFHERVVRTDRFR